MVNMSKKILFCASVDYHFKAFHLPYLKWFNDQQWEVHIAANGNMELPFVTRKFNIPIQRSPFHRENLKAYQLLKTLIHEQSYDLIHCHTPLGGLLARLASRKFRGHRLKVIYTAHGFHFCQGAPFRNWLFYYPIEKFLSHFTDCLITINHEDYDLAKNKKFKAMQIKRVHGVGIDLMRFKPVNELEQIQLRFNYGYDSNDFLLFYAAEFNKNKNHQMLIYTLALIIHEIPHVKLLFAGKGPLMDHCKQLSIDLGVDDKIDFLGFRDDIQHWLPMCDAAVSSSFREGLPVNIMEAMACGLPIVATYNRGHNELVDHTNGFIVEPNNVQAFANRLITLIESKDIQRQMGKASLQKIRNYSLTKVSHEMTEIYKQYGGVSDETQGQHRRTYI